MLAKTPDQRSDEELFAAYVAGQTAAFGVLFRRHAPVIVRVMQQGLPPELGAEDLVQQTFLQLHRARRDFRAGARLKPWLFTIALNVKRQGLRGLNRERSGQAALREAPVVATVEAHDPVRADEARRLRAALAELPASQAEAIALHWLAGLPFRDVAQVLGVSVAAVKLRAHRGYKKLREILESEDQNRFQ